MVPSPESVYQNLWGIVYWTFQCLTRLNLPLMQSYIKAGDFTYSTFQENLTSALVDNAIHYESYFFICAILFIYIVLKRGVDLDGCVL